MAGPPRGPYKCSGGRPAEGRSFDQMGIFDSMFADCGIAGLLLCSCWVALSAVAAMQGTQFVQPCVWKSQ
jgi:hypothetical protein